MPLRRRSPSPARPRGLFCVLAAIAGFIFTVACFHPGYVSPDSIWQLSQARQGIINDWHPPVMSWLWGVIDRIAPGAIGMLVLHNLMFWSGLGLLVYLTVGNASLAPILILLLGTLPPVFALLGTIWKDVGMGASLLLAFALLMLAEKRQSKAAVLGSLPLMFYGLAVRHNAIVAVFPFLLWAGKILLQLYRPKLRKPRRLAAAATALAVAILMTLTGLAMAASHFIVKDRHFYPIQIVLIYDLAAMSIANHQSYIPSFLYGGGAPMSLADIRATYSPEDETPLFWWGGGRFNIRLDPREIRELEKEWLEVVPRSPVAYAKYRAQVFASQLGIGREEVCRPYQDGSTANDLGISTPPSALNAWVMNRLADQRNGLLFRGWVYHALVLLFFLAMGLMIWAAPPSRRLNWMPGAAAGASALLYAACSFLISPACDFRYNWWVVLCALMIPLSIFSTVPAASARRKN